MKSFLVTSLLAVTALGLFVYAQDQPTKTMSTGEEVPKALTKEEAEKLSEEEWKKRLTPEQFEILRQAGTERPNGKVYKQFKAQGGGTYYCAGCNAELFSSKEKFDSGCGWPSFYDPAKAKNVKTKVDRSGFMTRTEVICAVCDGHLGHVFTGEGHDTPTDQRYCINGMALKFVPEEAVQAGKGAKEEKSKEEPKEEPKEPKSE